MKYYHNELLEFTITRRNERFKKIVFKKKKK